MKKMVQPATPNSGRQSSQVFYIDGCKVTVRYSGQQNPSAIKYIKDTLISSGVVKKN